MGHPVEDASAIAAVLRAGSDEIVTRWLERIASRVAVDKHFVFPSEDLIDDIPQLLDGIALHLTREAPELSISTAVVAKARELGQLRFSQGFSARQILWEYEILGTLILQFLDEADGVPRGVLPEPVVRRLLTAISTIQRATVEEFLRHSEREVWDREERLRAFNRALSHELRTEVGSILGAAQMLEERFVVDDDEVRSRFVQIVIKNGERIEQLLSNLLELARIDIDSRRHRNVLLPHAAAEVARRLRVFAEANDVRVEIAEDLPAVEVNAGVLDLALGNLIANGIKYHDPAKQDRRVRVRPRAGNEPAASGRAIIEVVDNGRGVAEPDRPRLFERYFRSEDVRDVEGSGLGLSLVGDAVEHVGGSVHAEFPETGETVFVLSLPARRAEDVRAVNASGGKPGA